jgi:hypothetical protein
VWSGGQPSCRLIIKKSMDGQFHQTYGHNFVIGGD